MTQLPQLPLIDTFGRVHNNLRISVTDRCNLRCTYCMPEDATFLDRSEILSFEEITRFVEIAVTLGIDKIRLTGGEPLLRRGLPELVRQLKQVSGVRDLGLTTNGLLLGEFAMALRVAGLSRLNISLDTLNPKTFRDLSRRDGLDRVLAGIEVANGVGFSSIKLNAVVIRGVNESEVVDLTKYAIERGLEMRFIEFMPIGAGPWEREKVVFAHEILESIEKDIGPLKPAENFDPRAPAMDFQFVDRPGRVGIIASVSRPFCQKCNRIRLTADGKLRNCLFAIDEVDVKERLRKDDREGVASVIRQVVTDKWEGHEINTARFIKPLRTMHAIGG
ncbi:MAG: GTP 3',8-cyclase MoaA [Gemmataceae bacterium]